MLPCWELFDMDQIELADALANAELVSAEMVESSNRSLALLDRIAELERAASPMLRASRSNGDRGGRRPDRRRGSVRWQ
jgi:hypothetical protein